MGGYNKPGDWWRSSKSVSGGILYDWGVHLLEYSLQIVDSDMAEVTGLAKRGFWAPQTKWKADGKGVAATVVAGTEQHAGAIAEVSGVAGDIIPVQVIAGQVIATDTGIATADVTISTAELLALNATPKTLVAAPGAGWTLGAIEFTVPEGTTFLRIMIHVEGPAKAWVDDLVLEEVRTDGTVALAITPGIPPEHRLMEQWIRRFHGDGKPYLLFGRMLHPPPLSAATIAWHGKTMPAVLHNAFRAPDGTEAVILANGTGDKQTVSLTWQGHEQALTLEPQEVRLIGVSP